MAVVQEFHATPAAGSSITLTPSTTIASGSKVLIMVSATNADPTGVADQSTHAFTKEANATTSQSQAVSLWRIDAAASITSIVLTFAASQTVAARGWELSSMASGGPDQFATSSSQGGATVSVGPTSATAQASEFVVACVGINNNPSVTARTINGSATGTTADGTLVAGGFASLLDTVYETVTATGTQTAAFTLSGSNNSGLIVAAYKAASGGGGVAPLTAPVISQAVNRSLFY